MGKWIVEPNLVETRTQESNPVAGRKPWTAPVLTCHSIEDVTRFAVTNLHDANNSQS